MMKRISNLKSEYFHKCMEIYNASFPQKERHSVEMIEQRIKSGKEFLFAWCENGEVIGIALFWDLGINKIVIMDYYAIHKDHRNNGNGDIFLNKILNHFHNHDTNLMIEVENPNINQSEIKSRRVKFYEKLNFKELKNFEYLMPSINDLGPVEMILMVNPCMKIDKFTKLEMKQIVGKIYQEMYYQSKKSQFYREELNKIDRDYMVA